jgi:hypothetical protein
MASAHGNVDQSYEHAAHWKSMISLIDKCVPPARRDTVRALAGEIDQAIGGFVRGQSALSLVLALFYAVTLSMIGLKHGVLIGFAAGLLSFIPYVGSLIGNQSYWYQQCSSSGNLWRTMCWLRIPAIVTTCSDGSRPPVPIDRDQFDGAVRCIF